jgi:hypothetical protein
LDRPDEDATVASLPLPLALAFALPVADGSALPDARPGALTARCTSTWLLPQMLDPIALSIDDAPASAAFPTLPARKRSERSPALSPPSARLIVCCLEPDTGADLGGGIRSHGASDTAHAPPCLSSSSIGTSLQGLPSSTPGVAGTGAAAAGASQKNSEKMSLSSESASANGNQRPASSSCATDAGAGAAAPAAFSGLGGSFRLFWLCMTTWPLHQSSSMRSSSSLQGTAEILSLSSQTEMGDRIKIGS